MQYSFCYALLLTLLASFTGCATFNWKQPSTWIGRGDDSPPKPQTPNRMVAVWKDTVLHTQGKTPVRGFGGRLMFYNEKDADPITVEGTLVVYAFDEAGRDPADSRPDRKYVFPAPQFETHYSKSKLGHSYSVWLPWDEIGGEKKRISLIARFQPNLGPLVVSESTDQLLPGVGDENLQRPTTTIDSSQSYSVPQPPQPEVRRASHESAVPPAVPSGLKRSTTIIDSQRPNTGLSTSTIALPPNFGRAGIPASANMQGNSSYGGTVYPTTATASAAPQVNVPDQLAAGEESAATVASQPDSSRNYRRPLADSRRERRRALGQPIKRPSADRVPWRPNPIEWRHDSQ